MKYKVLLEKKAKKHLENIKSADVAKIRKKIIKLKDGFLPELDIKKLKGYPNHYRLRIGGYRVLFELQQNHIIIIYAILPRKKAYK